MDRGTYVITGGLSVLGLATCDFLIEKGARRIVIVSRRALPPRSQWAKASESLAPILARIQGMESKGATIRVVSLDMGNIDAHEQLLTALDNLSLPPVRGVIHASGVLEDSLLVDTSFDSFERVLAPQISAAQALHKAVQPGSLDFYSSFGQLVGTASQSSYASGNACLDSLAQHRRNLGETAVAFQWPAWRAMSMGTSAFLALELRAKGITDITAEEAQHDAVGAVITRTAVLDDGEPAPLALFADLTVRRSRAQGFAAAPTGESSQTAPPTSTPELKKWLKVKISLCLGDVLKISDIDDIDPRVPLADIGIDSVMTIVLRQKLQSVQKATVPQTLTWNYPTVSDLVGWFVKHFEEEGK